MSASHKDFWLTTYSLFIHIFIIIEQFLPVVQLLIVRQKYNNIPWARNRETNQKLSKSTHYKTHRPFLFAGLYISEASGFNIKIAISLVKKRWLWGRRMRRDKSIHSAHFQKREVCVCAPVRAPQCGTAVQNPRRRFKVIKPLEKVAVQIPIYTEVKSTGKQKEQKRGGDETRAGK